MAINIRELLTPQEIARLDATQTEMERLFRLSDRWLAEELLKLARQTRREFPDKLGHPHDIIYDSNFVWHLVPEVAKRLGATRLEPNEATDPEIVYLSDAELRQACGIYLQNLAIPKWVEHGDREKPTAGELLTHTIANGNPVAFAVDRIAPAPDANQDHDDHIAMAIREISSTRGFEQTPYWSPELQHKHEPEHEHEAEPVPHAASPGFRL